MAERATPLDGKPSERATPIRRPRADQARLVADVLRHQIHAGGYPDGLPPEADLATISSCRATPFAKHWPP